MTDNLNTLSALRQDGNQSKLVHKVWASCEHFSREKHLCALGHI